VAEVIAKRAGAGIDPRPFPEVLRGQLFTGADPKFLRADLGSRASELSESSSAPLWWPVTKVAGMYLAPYLAARATAVASAAPGERTVPEEHRMAFLPSYFENNPWGE
jgi:predicted nicotinamide N-methyase